MRELHRKMKWADADGLKQLIQGESQLKDTIAQRMASVKQEVEQHEQ